MKIQDIAQAGTTLRVAVHLTHKGQVGTVIGTPRFDMVDGAFTKDFKPAINGVHYTLRLESGEVREFAYWLLTRKV